MRSQEEILQMATEMLERDDNLRRALEVFQLSQDAYLSALKATNSIFIYSDDKTTESTPIERDKNANLG
jgi:hypothetical protein